MSIRRDTDTLLSNPTTAAILLGGGSDDANDTLCSVLDSRCSESAAKRALELNRQRSALLGHVMQAAQMGSMVTPMAGAATPLTQCASRDLLTKFADPTKGAQNFQKFQDVFKARVDKAMSPGGDPTAPGTALDKSVEKMATKNEESVLKPSEKSDVAKRAEQVLQSRKDGTDIPKSEFDNTRLSDGRLGSFHVNNVLKNVADKEDKDAAKDKAIQNATGIPLNGKVEDHTIRGAVARDANNKYEKSVTRGYAKTDDAENRFDVTAHNAANKIEKNVSPVQRNQDADDASKAFNATAERTQIPADVAQRAQDPETRQRVSGLLTKTSQYYAGRSAEAAGNGQQDNANHYAALSVNAARANQAYAQAAKDAAPPKPPVTPTRRGDIVQI
jgi:hypothetical protein